MKYRVCILFFLLGTLTVYSQVTRVMPYNGNDIAMLAWNNRMQEHFSFPGMQVFIIIGDSAKTLKEIFDADEIHRYPAKDMNSYSCFYFLKKNAFLNNKPLAPFLTQLIGFFYEQDLIDRNRVHLVWQNDKQADTLLHKTATIDSLVSSETIMKPMLTAQMVWLSVRDKQTKKQYTVPRMQDMEEKTKEENRREIQESYKHRKGDLFFALTIGRHQIDKQYKTATDTVTMVDFTKLKTLWGIQIGYYFAKRFHGAFDIGIMYSGKQKRINNIDWGSGGGVTVRGSGQAGAMIRYGIAVGWLPIQKDRFSVLLNLSAGRLTAIAGGGTATRTIGGGGGGNTTDIIQKKEYTHYIRPTTGIEYKLSRLFYFTSQLQFMIAGLKQPLGSVTAFTGWSVNIGLGFSVATKKNKNED